MNAADLIAELGHRAGLPALRLNDQGLCRLVLDGSLVIDFEHDEDTSVLHVYSRIGSLPSHGRERLYEELLSANLFGDGTSGATLAVDTGRREIVLCRRLTLEGLGIETLVAAVESFADAAERWIERVASAPADSQSGPGNTPPGFEGMLRA